MIVKLKKFSGETVKTIEQVTSVSKACIESHVVIESLKENFIFTIQEDEYLSIDKTDND